MVISAYLYHSQSPMPPQELWLQKAYFSPCEANEHMLFMVYAAEIAKFNNTNHTMEEIASYTQTSELISAALGRCEHLLDMAREAAASRSQSAATYYDALRALPPLLGLELEAARSLLSSTGGDILKMATNAIYETNTRIAQNAGGIRAGQSVRVFMDDFASGDSRDFSGAARVMLSTLMTPAEEQGGWRNDAASTSAGASAGAGAASGSGTIRSTRRRVASWSSTGRGGGRDRGRGGGRDRDRGRAGRADAWYNLSQAQQWEQEQQPGRVPPPFWSRLSLAAAVERAVEVGFVDPDTQATRQQQQQQQQQGLGLGVGQEGNRNIHVTQGSISEEEREEGRDYLRAHPVFGPLLLAVTAVLES
jgi:hypothetical protein